MGIEDFTTDQWFKNGSLQTEALADHVLDNLHIVTVKDSGECLSTRVSESVSKQPMSTELGRIFGGGWS
jgi:hypothetical protein